MTAARDKVEPSKLESVPYPSKLRWLFLGVSGTLLAFLLVSGVLAVRFLGAMRTQELSIERLLAERTETLSALSLSIQSYNEAVQQFVTEARADQEQQSRERLDLLTLEIDSDLRRYPTERDSTEDALLDELLDIFSRQRTLYVAVLERSPDERRRQAQSVIAGQIAPLQKKILDWSTRLQTWNKGRLKSADQSRITDFAGAQDRLAQALAIGFGSGFLLLLAGMAYIARLERQTRVRYNQLAQSRQELQRLSERLLDAQETERRSISRELHDEVGQALGALLVDLGRLSAVLPNGRPEVKAQLENMKSVTERTIQAVRDIALLLRPSMLDDLGLVAALEWQGREVSRRSEIEVEVESENVSDALPEEYRICVYRLVQEALGNTVRHSGAKNARVIVRQSANNITVRVTDDGRGFDTGRTRGLGLLGMEERVKRLDGTLILESKPGHGVTLTVELPLPSMNGGMP